MFLIKITHTHATSNQLQAYLDKQLRQLECMNVADPETLRKHLERTVHRANIRFPRCRPLNSYLHTAYTNGDYSAGVKDVLQFSLYAHRGVFEETPRPTPALVDTSSVLVDEGDQTRLFS